MEQRLAKLFGENAWNNSNNCVSFVKAFGKENISESMAWDLAGIASQRYGGSDIALSTLGTLSIAAKHHVALFDTLVHGYERVAIFEGDTDFNIQDN
jgi:hypothetical protein